MTGSLVWSWLGRVDYAVARQMQIERRQRVMDGTEPEVLWLLEHEPVITTGRRPVPGLPSAKALATRGIGLHHSERGGLATWHGPGQLIAYAIVDAGTRNLGVRGTIHAMEAGVITTLADLGVSAHRREGYPGVWCGTQKICAVGMHFRRGVSMHGIALNLRPDLDGFELIIPCGIEKSTVTSVAQMLGEAPSPEATAPILAAHIVDALETQPTGQRALLPKRKLTPSKPNDSSRAVAGT